LLYNINVVAPMEEGQPIPTLEHRHPIDDERAECRMLLGPGRLKCHGSQPRSGTGNISIKVNRRDKAGKARKFVTG